jgi:transposase InsO family protein
MGPGIAQLYLDHLYPWYGLPKKIISDRDPRFTSSFGKALTKRLRIQQNLSTTAHPRTNGLSERKNQWIEQYLRLVTSGQPDNWTEWVTVATAVHNNWKNSTTGLLPNQILIGYEPTLGPGDLGIRTNNEVVEQ